MRERPPSVANADGPAPRQTGTKLIVDHDESARGRLDAGLVESQIVRIGTTADGHEHVASDNLLWGRLAADSHCQPFSTFFHGDAFGVEAHLDTLALQNCLHLGRNVIVVATNQPVQHFHRSKPATETAIPCGNPQPYNAPAPTQHN